MAMIAMHTSNSIKVNPDRGEARDWNVPPMRFCRDEAGPGRMKIIWIGSDEWLHGRLFALDCLSVLSRPEDKKKVEISNFDKIGEPVEASECSHLQKRGDESVQAKRIEFRV
jgi:hypothetical protein